MPKSFTFEGPYGGFSFSDDEKLPQSVADNMKNIANFAIDSHTEQEEEERGFSVSLTDLFQEEQPSILGMLEMILSLMVCEVAKEEQATEEFFDRISRL